MMPGLLGPTRRDSDEYQLLLMSKSEDVRRKDLLDCERRASWTRSMSWRGICSATETMRGISASMASRMATAAFSAGTKTAVASGFRAAMAERQVG